MNKRLLGILAAALAVIIGASTAWSMTWTENRVTMTAETASVVAIGVFKDCDTTIPFATYDWDGVTDGQHYEVTAYVKNTGNQAVYVTYVPPALVFDGGQTIMRLDVFVLEGPATSCQLLPISPVSLPFENPLVCERGFLLLPGKVIKLDIVLTVISVVAGGTWRWPLLIRGCAP